MRQYLRSDVSPQRLFLRQLLDEHCRIQQLHDAGPGWTEQKLENGSREDRFDRGGVNAGMV